MDFLIVVFGSLIIFCVAALVLKLKSLDLDLNSKVKFDVTLGSKKPLSSREIKCLKILKVVLRQQEILPQAGLSSFIRVIENDRSKRQSMFNRFSRKRCDFLICDDEFSVLGIIELDDSSHNKISDVYRDEICKHAGIETIRISKPEEAALVRVIDGNLVLKEKVDNERSSKKVRRDS